MTGLPFQKIIEFTECITEFVMLNIMWFAGCLLGGIVFGWAPSTVALLTVFRDKIMKKDYQGAISSFWTTYKKEFKKSNILGAICVLFLLIVSINKANFDAQPELIFLILSTVSTVARIFIFGIVLYMFPLYVHYDMELKKYFFTAINLLVAKPFVTICIAIWTLLAYLMVASMPAIIAVLGISLYFYGIMAINYQFFMRNEMRLRAENSK
ncbi:DUF624 domain-containing protein [Clostridium sp. SHJSY1]|uniref:YesL family protein n=1 Tax=Clostridium sp. SHJSY1 TaxID=2942483 RepID=UPI00287545D0|nr:DUF624 domain-containing protein [Clostridium sp. SHJSY1]MDS0525653.1 DUF624 domain-containing protein [Clostridium sp. SHJSY1]